MGRMKTWVAVAVACLGSLAIGAAPAGATFAGRNGQLSTAWLDNDQGAHEEAEYAVVDLPWTKKSAGKNIVECSSLDGCPVYAHPQYSPKGTEIVYDEVPLTPPAAPATTSELIIAAPNGSSPTTITDPAGKQNYFEPSFLPSGKRLVFVRSATAGPEDSPPPHGEIVTSDLTGGEVRVVTSVLGADPVVSPNGRKVLFDHHGGIWVVGIDGGTARPLIRNGGFPDFSPDGRSIVYLSGAKQTLHEARSDGSHARQVLGSFPGQRRRHPLQYAGYPRFSPDGKEIAFAPAYYDPEGDPYVVRVPAAGGRVTPLWTTPSLDAGGTDLGIAWQPLPAVG